MNILRRMFQPSVIVVLAIAVAMSVAGKEAMAGGSARCPCDFNRVLNQINNEARHADLNMAYTFCEDTEVGFMAISGQAVEETPPKGVYLWMAVNPHLVTEEEVELGSSMQCVVVTGGLGSTINVEGKESDKRYHAEADFHYEVTDKQHSKCIDMLDRIVMHRIPEARVYDSCKIAEEFMEIKIPKLVDPGNGEEE